MAKHRDLVLGKNPIAFFEFQETSGTTVTSTVNGHTGTLNGGITLGHEGPKGSKAVYFDGMDDFISILNLPDFTGTRNFTIELWFKFANDQPQAYCEFLRRNSADNSQQFLMRTRGAAAGRPGDIEVYHSGKSLYFGEVSYGDSQWHQMWYSNYYSNSRLWVDAVENPIESGTVASGAMGTTPTILGANRRATDGVMNEFFKGYLANVAIYPYETYDVVTHFNAEDNNTTVRPYRGWGLPL